MFAAAGGDTYIQRGTTKNIMFPSSRTKWPSATPAEARHKRVALYKDAVVFVALVVGILMMGANEDGKGVGKENDDVVYPSPALAFALCGFMLFSLGSDLFLLPAPRRTSPTWNTISIIGHPAFFTMQTLFLQTAFALLKWWSFWTENAPLATVMFKISLWVDTQGIALTLLFFKLNWFEKKWQRDIQTPMEKDYPSISTVWLVGHVISFPVALLDALFLCPPAMMKVHGATLYAVVQIAFAYGFGYLLWAKFVEWRYNTLIYPFLADIDNWAKSLGFVIVVGTAVSAMAWVVSVVSYV